MLPEERIFVLLLQNEFPQILTTISTQDPDNDCRSLSQTISRSIAEVINSR
jgi:hypothetical protein